MFREILWSKNLTQNLIESSKLLNWALYFESTVSNLSQYKVTAFKFLADSNISYFLIDKNISAG